MQRPWSDLHGGYTARAGGGWPSVGPVGAARTVERRWVWLRAAVGGGIAGGGFGAAGALRGSLCGVVGNGAKTSRWRHLAAEQHDYEAAGDIQSGRHDAERTTRLAALPRRVGRGWLRENTKNAEEVSAAFPAVLSHCARDAKGLARRAVAKRNPQQPDP